MHQAAISQASTGKMPGAAPANTGGRNIYSDIKIAATPKGRILNPNIYGGIVVSKNGKKFSTGNDDLAYNASRDEWGQRTWDDKVLNALAPFGLGAEEPDYNRPATYSGGKFHTGINPAAAAASVLGMLGPPGTGTLAAPVAGGIYNALGGKNPVLTGPDTVYADDGTGGMARPGVSQPAGPMAGPSAQGMRGGSTGTGGMQPRLMPSLGLIPGPMQQQPAIPGPATPPQIFPPAPPVQTPFQVPGGKPYGFSLFGRAA